ncbi:DUF3800 domain-containing protein [Paenibacillus silvae]|uniref:DUF3800 domain-containing protein n=1 Tax=Paenibacillus silvae TaxID=1325358 RepID=UPI0025A1DF61|nr:DUF3800 domain-containing protein [Paenibacillus silvae]MDM5279346.1 DUF3800 domain-containing protein [Paenibacillus silvae]
MAIKKKKYIMFIDETGDATSTPFTLTGVIFENKYCVDQNAALSELKTKINQLKKECFGTNDIVLHLNDISKGLKAFAGIPKGNRKLFYDKLPEFLKNLEFGIISITIDSLKMGEYFTTPKKDHYVIAFTHLMEAFYSFLGSSSIDSGRIVLESRDDKGNLAVQRAFFEVFNNGTLHLDVENQREKIKGFIIAPKGDSVYQSGLEIADIICNPLSRVRQGKIEADPKCMRDYGKENKIFKAIKDKIYVGNTEHDFRNWGFKKVPIVKKKREWVDDPA